MNMGTMNRNHWSGVVKSENPQSCWIEHTVPSFVEIVAVVAFGQAHGCATLDPTVRVSFIQGTNLAPMLIMTHGEGPIIGLKFGLVWIGEPVSWAFLTISAMKTATWIKETV